MTGDTSPNLVLYVYDLTDHKFTKVGTVTKSFYTTDIEPKISFGAPEKQVRRNVTIQKLNNLNAIQFIDLFDGLNNDLDIAIDDVLKNEKFAQLFDQFTSCTGFKNNFATVLSLAYDVDKSKILESKNFHNIVTTEPPTDVTMNKTGKGELFINFYGNGEKGKLTDKGIRKGDVYMGGLLYELKKNQGRLPTGNKIKPSKEDFKAVLDQTSADVQVDMIMDIIQKAAGCVLDERYKLKQFVTTKLQDILDVLKHNINPELSNLQLKFVGKIIGCISLLGYQVENKFDRLVLFDVDNEVKFISFNFDGETTVEQLYNISDIKYNLDYNTVLGHQIEFANA
jgi:hypothetical protein